MLFSGRTLTQRGDVQRYDAIVVGGGPAGSSCATRLVAGGQSVLVIDRAAFPRVKLCAGWVSPTLWRVLDLSPRDYPGGLWRWRRCHVHFAGRDRRVPVRGTFIRRYELDHFLLNRSGAEREEGHAVRVIERDAGDWVVDGSFRAPVLVGAAGTHCPVSRQVFGSRPTPPVGALEHEFACAPQAVAATRAGRDGEPELLLHPDLAGYSWNVPKTSWLNVGCGTASARQVRDAWQRAREHFASRGHLPAEAAHDLDRMRGHSYALFHPAHLERCHDRGALLVGDALGLAHPVTAEGILPAVLSGRLCAEVVLAGDPESYGRRLREHPLFATYTVLWQLREWAARRSNGARSDSLPTWERDLFAISFARLFSGRAWPGAHLLARLIGRLRAAGRIDPPGTEGPPC